MGIFMKVVGVFDLKVGSFLSLFTVQSSGVAMRGFGDEVGKPDSPISAHPEDYELYELADFDEEQGVLAPHSTKKLLCRASDFLSSKPSLVKKA